MPVGANHFIGRQQPGHDARKEAHDAKEKQDTHRLVSVEGSIAHLDEDVDEHPEAGAGAKNGDGHDDERPVPDVVKLFTSIIPKFDSVPEVTSYQPNLPGACTIKLFTAVISDFRNKLKCLSLASLSSQV